MFVAGLLSSGFQDDVSFVSKWTETKCVIRDIGRAPIDDEDACERLRTGDQAALRFLMDRHAPMLLRLAMNVLSDQGEAEDVVQEVFITVWNGRDKWISGNAKFSTWLHRVTINKAIDKRRARRATPESSEVIAAISDATEAVNTPCEQVTRLGQAETSRKLATEISALPACQAQALRYFYFEERDVPEIAALMDTTEQAVRSLLKRGKQALRGRLGADEKTTSHDAFAVRGADRPVRTGGRQLAARAHSGRA